MGESSRLGAIASAKCPRCRQGDMFEYPAGRVDKFMAMHKNCPHCGLQYEREPGFFFGAMYISYAVSVGLFLVIGFTLYLTVDPPTWIYILAITLSVLLTLPFTFRFSRVLFLHWFGGFPYEARYGKS